MPTESAARLAYLSNVPICLLTEQENDELTLLLDLERAKEIERETGVNPLAVGCAGDD